MQLKNIILINVILTLIEIKEIKSFKCGSEYLNLIPGILDNENKIIALKTLYLLNLIIN